MQTVPCASRGFRRTTHIRQLWRVAAMSLLALLTCLATIQPAHAAGDPLVLIVADITSQYGPCTEIFHTNIGTPGEATNSVTCPAGTLRAREVVRLSQAVAQHEPYVIMVAPTAPAVDQLAMERAYQRLIAAQESAYQQVNSKRALHSLIACGSSTTIGMYWWLSDNTTEVYSQITYYKPSDCKSVTFDKGVIEYLGGDNALAWWWGPDKYASHTYWGPNGCVTITDYAGETQTYYPYFSATPGYYYENWMGYGQCGYYPDWNNMGPID